MAAHYGLMNAELVDAREETIREARNTALEDRGALFYGAEGYCRLGATLDTIPQ
jgi:hypothetical protein